MRSLFFTTFLLLLIMSTSFCNELKDDRDYYQILNVPTTASKREIKKAFRKLAIKFHPDKNKEPDSEANFKKISEAYDVLSDNSKRKQYDAVGHESFIRSGGPGAGSSNHFDMHNFFHSFDHFLHHRMHENFHNSHSQNFHFDFKSLFDDEDDDDPAHHFEDADYSFARSVKSQSFHEARGCRTKTVRQGNSVFSTTECF
ncbi:unnamed protein product [Protopolystoma xenopodis]|uniref:DnaJ homolog subfamily B member 9 n=1 Tax=Protopolystoma xenopodis TaxID=117903 RepID=A0A3S5BK85_9PLAT|nr:unnamed protein product [Protopolystoma xenopodis]